MLLRTILPLLLAAVARAQTQYAPDWSPLSPPSAPAPRGAPAMTYDAANGKVVLFGGFLNVGYSNETWTWDGATWTQAAPPTAPPARAAATLCYDAPTQRVILFGGYDGGSYRADTWVWDGAASTWTQLVAGPTPHRATSPMSFPDPLNGHVDLWGGYDGQFYQLGMWQWNGSGWTQLSPATVPYARSAAVAISDPPHGTVVLFGGLGSVNPNNTWTWDGTNWQQRFPAAQPPLRYASAGAFDVTRGRPVLFGGGDGGSGLADTWEWDGSNWIQLPTVNAPSPRESFGMTFDGTLNRVLLFGGIDDTNGSLVADTWDLDPQAACCSSFCAGDGVDPTVSIPCPCGNNGAFEHGCGNSVDANGALLSRYGTVLPDTMVLLGSQMPATATGIYLQGDALSNAVFGDGILCTSGTLIRLRTRACVGGASQFPDSTDTITLSARGGVVPGSGATRYYQLYYRNAAAAFCPPATFNVTNGWVFNW